MAIVLIMCATKPVKYGFLSGGFEKTMKVHASATTYVLQHTKAETLPVPSPISSRPI